MIETFSYKIIHESKLVVECFNGPVNLYNFIKLKKLQIADPEYDPSYNILGDLRFSHIEVGKEELIKCVGFLKNSEKLVAKRNSAIVTSTPNQVVYSILFARYSKELPVKYEVFSTLKEACLWLGLSHENILDVENILSVMYPDKD